MSKIPDNMREKINKNANNFLSVRDDDNNLIYTEDNPLEVHFVKHKYIDEPRDNYSNEEDKKNIFVLKRKNDQGELETVEYSTKSWNIADKISQLDAKDVENMRMWWTQEGMENTQFHIEPILSEEEKEEEDDKDIRLEDDEVMEEGEDADPEDVRKAKGKEEEEVDMEEIPF